MPHDEVVSLRRRVAERERSKVQAAEHGRRSRARLAAEAGRRELRVQARLRSRYDQNTIVTLRDSGVDIGYHSLFVDLVAPGEAIDAARAGIGVKYYNAREAQLDHDDIKEAFLAGIKPTTYKALRQGGHPYLRSLFQLSHAEVMNAARKGLNPDVVEAALRAGAHRAEAIDAGTGNADASAYAQVRAPGRSHRLAMKVATNPIAVGLLPSWEGTFTELVKTAENLDHPTT